MTQPMSPRENGNKKQTPRVSVVVPAYNHERYVGAAIQSVLNQTFDDFELIVIDDGSTDDTLNVIKTFHDPRIRLFTQENKGAARTINRGIDLAEGKFLSILNSDDVYHPDRLASFVSLMDKKPDCMIASSYIRPVDESGELVTPGSRGAYWRDWYEKAVAWLQKDKDPFVSILRHNFVATTSNIFTRTGFFDDNEPFNPLLAYCHDYEFLLRALKAYPFVMLDEKLLDYRIHEQNTIKENEFLKHLEVLYAVFTTVDFKDLLSKKSLEERMSASLFGTLFKNPEINPEKHHSDYMAIIQNKENEIDKIKKMVTRLHGEVEKREKKLSQADEWLKNLNAKLSDAENWLLKLKDEAEAYRKKLEENEIELELRKQKLISTGLALHEKNLTLQEIYNSKGWLWLTRYRKFKYKIGQAASMLKNPFKTVDPRNTSDAKHSRIGEALKDFMMRGSLRLFFYRKVKDNLKPPEPNCAAGKKSFEKSGATTQHIKILKPFESQRPVVVHALANFMTGGSSRLVADLIEHLGHRYEQEVITFFSPKPPIYSGFPVHELPRSANAIFSRLREKKPAILHVHYWGECDDPWYRRVFEAGGKTGCVIVENINTPVETYVDDVIDYYVYVSNYAKNFSSAIPEASTVIYPGSDLEMFKRNGAPVPDDVIGMVYRLENDKLREDSIQVFIEVVKRRPGTKAVVVGGGTLLEPYRRQVEKAGVSESFQFTGYVPYEALPNFYRRFSVFVAPVWKESFGQVSPFAMGMEIPVAGYDIGALPEILDGRECLGKDGNQLADIIVDLLDNREKRLELGARNRKRAFENFTVEAMVKQYELLYQRLLTK